MQKRNIHEDPIT
uniref:Uncharacterized protein n=4 Tax=Boreoeutheria TaxID=1437010 RepID=A0A8I5KPI3_HUMAN